jgi:AcrR family transcriptional regulator
MSVAIMIKVNEGLYQRDPQMSELGQAILKNSIILINELGINGFTFKKLADRIQSTEASVYRYFENKHLLLHYLINWYWEYVRSRIEFSTMNITDPEERLKKTFQVIITSSTRDLETDYIDEDILYRIVLLEGFNVSHTKSVDEENAKGFFLAYKGIVGKIAENILELNPSYPYPRNTANALFTMAMNAKHYAEHLPRLTDIKFNDSMDGAIFDMLCHYMDNIVKY